MTGTATYTEHGDGEVARAGEILRTVVGSGVHGIAIAGTDDHDEMGVFIVGRHSVGAASDRGTSPPGARAAVRR